MKTIPLFALLASLATTSLLCRAQPVAPASPPSPATVPPIIDAGFATWTKNGLSFALDLWQKGGLLEGTPKVVALAKYFKRIEPAVGNFKSYEYIDTRRIGASSQVVYVGVNFDRAAVYGRFLLYRVDENWVVQNLDFNVRPEMIVPWLAFAGADSADQTAP